MKKGNILIVSLIYLLFTIVMNILTVVIHEMGHALVYLVQGYKIDFSFTSVNAINGTESIIGAIAGVLLNIFIALIFLLIMSKRKSIYYFAIIASNTLFVRIIAYIISLLKGVSPTDEDNLGILLNINPVIISILGLLVMMAILAVGVRILFKQNSKYIARLILGITVLSSIVSLFVLTFLEQRGF